MIDKTVPIPREALAWFAGEMERQLRENDAKPGWEMDSLRLLCGRVDDEIRELQRALADPVNNLSAPRNYSTEDLQRIVAESADVANFAMMIADNARRELDRRIEEAQQP